MEILIILFFVFLIAFSKDNTDSENNDINWREDYKEKEESFYHPVTGYKGTKSEMDVYIINRERKLNDKE
jgi:hypothetical protein